MNKFSIIIPTINRYEELEANLESVCKQIGGFEKEIIIIDQNESPEFLEPILNKYSSRINVIHRHVKGKGASFARNIGIQVSSGNILLFPDDDCEFTPNLLYKVNEVFTSDPQLDGICIITRDRESGDKIALLKGKGTLIKRNNVLSTVIEAGIIIRKDKLGSFLFDEFMGVGNINSQYWSDEGPDLILRLVINKLRIIYKPDLFYYHPNPTKKYDYKTSIRAYQYGLGRGYFLKKNDYSIIFIGYYAGIYIIGMVLGFLRMNRYMVEYFWMGFRGRLKGYFCSSKHK